MSARHATPTSTAVLLVACATLAAAADQPVSGRKLVLKDVAGRQRAVFVSRDATVAPTPGGDDDPTLAGGSVQVVNPGTGESATFTLPASGWTANSTGTVFRFLNREAPAPPSEVKLALVKGGRLLKVAAKATGITLDEPGQGSLGLVLATGTRRYCALFGSTTVVRDEPGRFLARSAPSPAACLEATPTTTPTSTTTTSTTTGPGSSTTSTSTSASSTTTSTLPACDCCQFPRFATKTGTGSGTCGTVKNASGTTILALTCAGLYFGGSGNAVPLPAKVPDMGESVFGVLSCDSTAGAFVLGPVTAAETGSDRNCTESGCFFGAPLPLPNNGSPPTSTCVINALSADASGVGTCGGGADIDMPLNAEVFLTGDLLPDLGHPGIQPCPICEPSTDTCNGGPGYSRNGAPCVPGDSASLGAAFPTSHDCPPPSALDLGGLAIAFALATGTSSDTAQDLNGPATSNARDRVFCGFCRDANNTNGFGRCIGGPSPTAPCQFNLDCSPGGSCRGAVPCESDADCGLGGDPRESCEQRTNGAFGKAAATTISETGAAADTCLADGAPHPWTLGGVFCVPPTFDGTIDTVADLPGPGAVSLPGEVRLVP